MFRRLLSSAVVGCVVLWGAPAMASKQCAVTNISPPDNSGIITVTFDPGGYTEHIFTDYRGMTGHYTFRSEPFGIQADATCFDGTLPLVIRADGCDVITVPISGHGTGTSVALTPVEDGDATIVNVQMNFAPYTNTNTQQYRVNFYPVDGPPRIGSFIPPLSVPYLRYTEPGYVVVTARSCGPGSAEASAKLGVNGVTCDDCPTSCVGDPVRLDNRNLRLIESDPIAGSALVPFRRYYDSRRTHTGWFGTGWTSIFDPRLYHAPANDGAPEAVSLTTEEGVGYLFFKESGAFVQRMPQTRGNPSQLSYNATAAEWTHTSGDGLTARVFTSSGKLARYVDLRTGRATEVLYDSGGRPAVARDAWGAWSWTVQMHPTLPLVISIAVDGRSDLGWTYEYDNGQLVRAHSPLGLWRTYIVADGVPKEVRDGVGRVLETHDMVGKQATSSYGPSGEIQSIVTGPTDRTVGPAERLTTVTFLSGAVEKHYLRTIREEWRVVEKVGGCGSCGLTKGAVFVRDMATADILRQQDERGYVTESTYSSSGRLKSARTALKPVGCDPATATNRCRQTVENLRTVALEATPSTSTTNYVYGDAAWPQKPTEVRTSGVMGGEKVETFTYDALSGEVLTASVSGWTGEPKRQETRTTTTILYDGTEVAAFVPNVEFFDPSWATLVQPRSLRKTINGPRTNVGNSSGYVDDLTTYVYYPNHSSVPAHWRGLVAAVRNAAGHVSFFGDYDIFGNARRVIDANGVETKSMYDVLGRLTETRIVNATGCTDAVPPVCTTDVVMSRTYDGAGPVKQETSARGGVMTYEYDARGRVSSVSRGPSATDLRERRTTSYDPATGKPSVTATFAREANAWVEKTRQTSVYDIEGHLKETVHADQTRVVYGYDSADQLVNVQDENHSSPNTTYVYDAVGRLTRVEQTLATAPSGKAVTSYSYDVAGNLVSVTDPNGNVTTYVYDDFGEMLKQTSPVTGVTTYTYDVIGNLTGTTDASGATTTRTYDALGRVLTATTTRGASTETVQWTYDSGTFGIGRLRSMTDGTGSTTYAYDRRGLLLQETKTIEGAQYVTSYAYDASGNRAKITYPSGRVVTYGFDYADRPVSATLGTAPLVTGASYLPFGPMTELTYANGTVRRMTYDTRYRVQTNLLGGPTGTVLSYQYGYDAAGNVTRIHDLTNAAYNRDFSYDDINRLTAANTGAALWGNATYTYDAMGNLRGSTLGTTTRSFAYVGTTPKLATVTTNGATETLTYDSAGNERTVGATEFQYSPRNQLTMAGSASYRYDGRGVRTVATVPPPPITSLTLSPTHIFTHQSSVGTIRLSSVAPAGGADVQLTSPDAGIRIPATVTVAAGADTASFNVELLDDTPRTAAMTATYSGGSVVSNLTVSSGPDITQVTVQPVSIVSGESASVTVTLAAGAPPHGARVDLLATAGATLQPSVTIPQGEAAVTVAISGQTVATTTEVVVRATYANVATAVLQVRPTALTSLSISPKSLVGGRAATGTVTLAANAPAGGTTVTLTSSNPAVASVPANVVVPAGLSTTTFNVTTTTQPAVSQVTISGAYDGVTRSDTIQVGPCAVTTAAAPPVPADDRVFIDDALPAGATMVHRGLVWDASQKARGSQSLVHAYAGEVGYETHISNLTQPLHVGEKLALYFLINECLPAPRQVRLQFQSDRTYTALYWGESTYFGGGTNMGAVPAPGVWHRVEIPLAGASMEAQTLTSIRFTHYGGQVWFDGVAKAGQACVPAVAPQPAVSSDERVLIDDSVPAGATLPNFATWDTTHYATGTKSLTHVYFGPRLYQIHVTPLSEPLHIGEKLVVYLRVNECALPRQIRVQLDTPWTYGVAYWGDAVAGGMNMGAIPTPGVWHRVEIPLAPLRLEGHTLTRLRLEYTDGQVWFDRVAKTGQACVPVVAPQPTLPPGDRVIIEDGIPAGATLSANHASWDTVHRASGAKSLTHAYFGSWSYTLPISQLSEPLVAGEKFVFYMRVNECALPRQIRVQLNTQQSYGRVAWGEPAAGATNMGAVPAAGVWHRIEIPLASLNLEGQTLTKLQYDYIDGQAWFDRIGFTGAPAPATITSFEASHSSPQPPGTTIVWTANATGSVHPLEYQFERQDSGVWQIVQAYGTGNTYSWTPQASDAGEHAVRVSVRNGGSTAAVEDVATRSMTISTPGAMLHPAPDALLARLRRLFIGERIPVSLGVSAGQLAQNAETRSRYHLYTPELNLLAETSEITPAEKPIAYEYIWFAGEPLAQVTSATNEISYYVNDHLGTPLAQTNAAGEIVWRVEYEPYGSVHAHRTGASRHQPLRFPGQESYESDIVTYNIFRWYRAGWGRMTQPDPLLNLGFARSLQMFLEDAPSVSFDRVDWYGYGANNPLFFIDPLGLKVKNNTNCRIYVKDATTSQVYPVYPGQEWPGPQDGYADPCKFPNQVFKTVDGVDVTVGSNHQPDTNASGVISGIGQIIKGGWKDKDWQKGLQKDNDKGWDPLFDKSQPGKCLCCVTTP